MLGTVYVDLFATKALEYLLAIGFLGVFVTFWKYLNRPARAAATCAKPAVQRGVKQGSWFAIPRQLYYHPGHSWACRDGEGVVTVGVDDFGQKLIGVPESVDLPAVGTTVEQGERGCAFTIDARTVDLLSPVDGEVVARNDAVVEQPDLINDDPYGDGWLLKIRATRMRPNLRNLLHDNVADAWMETTEADLRQRMAGDLGSVLQDGGAPVRGIARALSRDHWDDIAKDYLLTS